jgi:hypothetical protein
VSATDSTLADATLYALALGCPRCARATDCPLTTVHKLPVSMRFSAIRKLSAEERSRAMVAHPQCLGGALRHGPLIEGCTQLLHIERRIGTEEEQPGDLDHAVLTAHNIRNMMMHIMAEDDDLLMQ